MYIQNMINLNITAYTYVYIWSFIYKSVLLYNFK